MESVSFDRLRSWCDMESLLESPRSPASEGRSLAHPLWVRSAFAMTMLLLLGCDGGQRPQVSVASSEPFRSLFDGTLTDWKSTEFGGEGEAYVEGGRLILDFGAPLTGVTFQRDFPKTDYELELTATRLEGLDFFVGLTFPVGESHCSLILGGWGGGTTGLSCLDERDASSNETTKILRYENGRAYHVRLQVTTDSIRAWLDGESLVDVSLKGRRVSLRPEVALSRPLGLASFNTRTALERLRWRPLRNPK